MSRVGALLDALELQLGVVARVGRVHLDLTSRCEDWTIGQVLEHSLGVTRKFADFARGVTSEPHAPHDEILGRDHRAAAAGTVAYARGAWRTVDLTRNCHLPFGTFSAEAAAGINLFDVLAHTWDVAASIQIDVDQDDALWVVGLDAAKEVIAPSRDPVHYSAEIAIALDAPPMQRFLAYLGRRVP